MPTVSQILLNWRSHGWILALPSGQWQWTTKVRNKLPCDIRVLLRILGTEGHSVFSQACTSYERLPEGTLEEAGLSTNESTLGFVIVPN